MKTTLSALAKWLFTLGLVACAVVVAIALWNRYETQPWTRDGHVRADVVRVTPDVGGLVTSVRVHDNEEVKVGQLLFVVDRPRYEDALAESTAAITSAKAVLSQAQRQSKRDLALGDLVATEAHEQNAAKVETALAALNEANAKKSTAQLNVTRTEVRATVNGLVTNLDLHPGDYIGPGTQALALVDSDSIRVEGYFEETKLRHIHVGSKARITLMGDDRILTGHVESISGGIADDQRSQTSNLLPSVAPTFSWVRLAQRFPVRIRVDSFPADIAFIPGRTATVAIEYIGGKHGQTVGGGPK
ncbi:efflux RND transporter periplasmic adaptor subunit [Paraburkholderia sp. BL25I1N1]|uniref:efflux RND transporter periplasmic adaptor subunit n=1 Tax=Paraburkholderia sp. BL25I1N1 TaxID=1938804 RepID=UPI000D063D5F|nr:efflux RND transporter periplasmic adaptor subunit [Paraburkholderia sp. BL25I1N1]PRY05991.1 RND family efflux transporter MFP subunit [Paraburkholderia sp. BL25I1N1]